MNISYAMRSKLYEIAHTSGLSIHGDSPGILTFFSGFPTYEALARRGLVVVTGHPTKRIAWIAELTEAGWIASGCEKPKVDPT